MKPDALVPYPMTPPDDPPEPDLSDALPCPQCQYPPAVRKRWDGLFMLHCDQGHVDGGWHRNFDKAVEYYNAECEEMKGEQLKAQGTEVVASHNEEWAEQAIDLIKSFARSSSTFTVQDVRTCQLAEWLGQPKHPNAWGAAFSVAAKQGLIVRVGYVKNGLASAHSRVVAQWRGAK